MKTIKDQPIIQRLLDRLTRVEQLLLLDNLLSKAMPIPFSACYAWLGWDSGNGFANMKLENRTIKVHRLTWCLKNGTVIPPELVSDHACRVRCCINPDHTEPATVRDNTHRGSAVLFKASERRKAA